jgi:hypothetical protein
VTCCTCSFSTTTLTNSLQRGPFRKQADGSWTKLNDPKNQGGDDNVYYEDKWAFLWPIDNSVKGFAQSGCAVGLPCRRAGQALLATSTTASPGEMLRHVAYEGKPYRSARLCRRPVHGRHEILTPRNRRTQDARATRWSGDTRTSRL